MKVEIAAIVDWIDLGCRFRGLIIDITNGTAAIVVVGCTTIHLQPLGRLVPVASSADYLKLCNP